MRDHDDDMRRLHQGRREGRWLNFTARRTAVYQLVPGRPGVARFER